MITILDPLSESGIPIEDYRLGLDVRRRELSIALISNGFPDASSLLVEVGRCLSDELDSPRVELFARTDPSSVIEADSLRQIAGSHDAVVTAMGHCGSCTSSTIRDSVAFARAGIPAVALVTHKFLESAAYVALSVGMPDIPRVTLP